MYVKYVGLKRPPVGEVWKLGEGAVPAQVSSSVLDSMVQNYEVRAIFTPGSEEMQTAFNYAISFHNNNDTQARFKVEPVVEALDSDDSYKIGQTLCSQMERGIFALITPTSDPSYDTFAAYSNMFQMPLVSPAFPQQTSSDRPSHLGVSLRPRYLRAIVDLINFYKWKTIIYLYDSDNGK
ncbi:glutamate receptor 1 [Trichonephila clavipes]|uniref:Glutamate receptor 1 n=2 Tax=Trichonephila TaxID=2585208 RepID=A0A8X6S966_TRICX|nr:glutamate receptor 1 [Trichonephila clavipes]